MKFRTRLTPTLPASRCVSSSTAGPRRGARRCWSGAAWARGAPGRPAARADVRAARPRRHVRRAPDRAGAPGLRTPACSSCTTRATARCAATASSPCHDDRARARPDRCRRRPAMRIVLDAPAGQIRARARVDRTAGRRRASRRSVVHQRAVVRACRRPARERSARARCRSTSPSAAPSTRSSTAKPRDSGAAGTADRPAADGHGDQARGRGADHGRASARARAARHLRHDFHRAGDCRTARICATSRSSRKRKSTARPAARARARCWRCSTRWASSQDGRPFVHESIIGTTFSRPVVQPHDRRRLSGDRAGADRPCVDHGRAHVHRARGRRAWRGIPLIAASLQRGEPAEVHCLREGAHRVCVVHVVSRGLHDEAIRDNHDDLGAPGIAVPRFECGVSADHL